MPISRYRTHIRLGLRGLGLGDSLEMGLCLYHVIELIYD